MELELFDVKYVLGGREKRVRRTYIACVEDEEKGRPSCPRETFTVEVPEVSGTGQGLDRPGPRLFGQIHP